MNKQADENTDKLLAKLQASRAKLKRLQAQVLKRENQVESDRQTLMRALSRKPVDPVNASEPVNPVLEAVQS
jgi:outer membrane protein TolC